MVLPIAAWWAWTVIDQDKGRRGAFKLMFGGGLLAAGMALAYYRMSFHYLAFVGAAGLTLLVIGRFAWRKWSWLILIGIMAMMAVLFLPWLQKFAVRPNITPFVLGTVSPEMTFLQTLQSLQIGWPATQAVAIFLGSLLAIRRRDEVALPVIWLWVLVGLPALRTLPLPGVSIIQDFTINTSLYIPLALIWAVLVGDFLRQPVARKVWISAPATVLMMGIGLWHLPTIAAQTDRAFDLSSRPDLRAAEWIKRSLPEESVFLINGIVYTDGTTAIGGDGGWWLPLLARRSVTIPPQYALIVERPMDPNYSEAVNHLVRQLFDTSAVTLKGKEAICNFPDPITHLYLGQQRGLVDKPLPSPPPHPMLPADALQADTDYKLIYHQDRVMIFEFNRAVCAGGS
jgi:hypothetical protein